MKKLILLGLAAVIASAAMASTTFDAVTGLIYTPTAAVAPVDTMNFAVDYYDVGPTYYPIRATYGIAENWEVGAKYVMNSKTVGISGKWLTPLTPLDTKLAIGGNIQSYSKMVIYDVYGAMTRDLGFGFTDVAFNGTAALACNAGPGLTTLNPAIGVDATFAQAGDLNVSAEYIFRGSTFGFKGAYGLGDGFGVQAGLFDGDLFLGVNYTYDAAK
jgi:hypothetical protein